MSRTHYSTEADAIIAFHRIASHFRATLSRYFEYLGFTTVSEGRAYRSFTVFQSPQFPSSYRVNFLLKVQREKDSWYIKLIKRNISSFFRKAHNYWRLDEKHIEKIVRKLADEAVNMHKKALEFEETQAVSESWEAAGNAALSNANAPGVPMLRVSVDQQDAKVVPAPGADLLFRVSFRYFDCPKLFTAEQVSKLSQYLVDFSGQVVN